MSLAADAAGRARPVWADGGPGAAEDRRGGVGESASPGSAKPRGTGDGRSALRPPAGGASKGAKGGGRDARRGPSE